MSKIKYNKIGGQEEFQTARDKFVLWTTGFGGGKTYGLVMKGLWLMDQNPGFPGGLISPSIKMYKRDVLPIIEDICLKNGLNPSYNKSDMIWTFHETRTKMYIFHGEDEGRSIKGPNLAWMLMNEVTLMDRMTILNAIARVRLKSAKLLQTAMSGTPEGFTYAHEHFIESQKPGVRWITSRSDANSYVDGSYFQMLRDQYDPLMVEQYVEGKFINLTGNRCAWAFDRAKHTRPDINQIPGLPVVVSMDFNVDPMAATLWNRIPFGYDHGTRGPKGHYLHGFDEIKIRNSNTPEMCRVLKERFPHPELITIYPDPAGVSRSTKSYDAHSDIDLLRRAGFINIKYRPMIRLKRCWNSLNAALAKNWIMLNSKKCRETIKDLEQCVFKNDTFEIDKANTQRSHWLDGTKNMVEYEFPIDRGRPSVSTERMR